MFDGLIVDNFAGGGGASIGIERAMGRAVDLAINHDPAAVAMHEANHPHTRHLTEDVWRVDIEAETAGRPVELAWFSPDCTHHSRAKGMKPLSKKIRGLAWIVIRWARRPRNKRPRLIFLENVREFEEWGPLNGDDRPCPERRGMTFRLFVNQLRGLGYAVEWRSLNAADYGAPTHRRRLFLVARCDGQPIVWPEPTHGPGRAKPWRTAAEIIDWSLPCHSIFLTKEEGRAVGVKRPLAENTMKRIANGVRRYVIEASEPFIVRTGHWSTKTGEGTGFRGQGLGKPLGAVCATTLAPSIINIERSYKEFAGQAADRPLGTITCFPKGGKHALVSAFLSHFNNGGKNESDCREPMRTVTAGGLHAAEVRAFLIKYYGQGVGQRADEPLHTVVSRDRFGLVTVAGEPYQIVDIGLRMLTPRELARAQGFPESYVLTGNNREQVARIGNSVSPVMSEALVRANVGAVKAAEVMA